MENRVTIEYLAELIIKVPDAYLDFINGFPKVVVKENLADEIIEYLEKNPDAHTDDILEYFYVLRGSPPQLEIAD